MKIFRDSAGPLTVAKAKRLVLGGLPPEQYVEVPLTVDKDGEIADVDLDGLQEKFDSEVYARGLETDFSDICKQLAITPRFKWRPSLTDYNGSSEQDEYYTITHEEFVRLAGLYGLNVEVSVESVEQGSHVREYGAAGESSSFDDWATKKELIAAFVTFTGMDDAWFDNVNDKPKLKAARRVIGTRGTAAMYCPYEVMQWLVDAKRKTGKPLREEKGWEILEKHFPTSHRKHSIGDPRE